MKNDDNFRIHGMEIVERECLKGPVVFATMHFGNMESMLKFSEKYPFVTVAKNKETHILISIFLKTENILISLF